jgi:hypothetical protein
MTQPEMALTQLGTRLTRLACCALCSQSRIVSSCGSCQRDQYALGTTRRSDWLMVHECARLAKEVTNEQHRDDLKEMEDAWTKLAEEAEKK